MSTESGVYSFLPWLRQGIANTIASADMDTAIKSRAHINVEISIDGSGGEGGAIQTAVSKDIELYGPGDIIGIDTKSIIKTEPRNWITNFEPNYVPYIDFYDEDFPWRYTPAAPDSSMSRLRPWIMLVVLTEDEFTDGKNVLNKPLGYIDVPDAGSIFPPSDQLWAWAHVHVNNDITGDDEIISTTMNPVLTKLKTTLNRDPDLAYSRIISPRKLADSTAYHAFMIPVFETGRLAGIGLDPADVPDEVHATFCSWDMYSGKQEPESFPYYYRWYFRTGTVGDFEYLVRLLEPKKVDSSVGKRDLDVQNPGSNIEGINDPELGGVLKLGGALKVPFDTLGDDDKAEVLKYENWADPKPHQFQSDVASFINLRDEYALMSSDSANNKSGLHDEIRHNPDPLITPPLYGKWHAMVKRLLKNSDGTDISPDDNWIHELNLDPRWRTIAGLGRKVIRERQEEYMDSAWGQVGDIIEANKQLRFAQLAKIISASWYRKSFLTHTSDDPERLFMLTAPLQKRIMTKGKTAYFQMTTSMIPTASVSPVMRRIIRPRGKLIRALNFNSDYRLNNLLRRINTGQVSPAPLIQIDPQLPTIEKTAESVKPKGILGLFGNLLMKQPWIQFLFLVLAILSIIILFAFQLTGAVALSSGISVFIVSLGLFVAAGQILKREKFAQSLLPGNQTPELVDEMPKSPDFRISETAGSFRASRGTYDSPEAKNFKTALRGVFAMMQKNEKSSRPEAKHELLISEYARDTVSAINPERTISRLVLGRISIPSHILERLNEQFKEAMAYPEFDIPMYKPLVDISSELFLPNINKITQNSITLLETNQKFIESYMVGLNHEFARELLWREYPTDQRGSYFRQFWDVNGIPRPSDITVDEFREQYRDIPPLDKWSKYSNLGDHDHRERGSSSAEDIALVIRGELLKKYPTAVIYAKKAKWQTDSSGAIDTSVSRTLDDSLPEEDTIKIPLYHAKVEPDIYFFGFDLTVSEVKGESGENPDDEAGWFFVIEERSGEPRFGLDINREGNLEVWNDLAWPDVMSEVVSGEYIRFDDSTPHLVLESEVPDSSPKFDQSIEDRHIEWKRNSNSAEIAYMLFQAPVSVAVHASEMLP